MGGCRRCLNRCAPLIAVGLIAWSFYIYCFQFCLLLVKNQHQKIIYLTIVCLQMAMITWCFLAVMCKSVAVVPNEYRLSNSDHNLYLNVNDDDRNSLLGVIIRRRNLLIYTCTTDGQIRYCLQCRQIKPDRCHHCSVCGVCVLKMDHHCPWINNCVGHSNYKQFFLLIFYLTMYSLFSTCTSFEYLIFMFQEFTKEYTLTIGGIILAIVALLVFIVLYGYHVHLVIRNQTTLEALREPVFCEGNMTFDLGYCSNIKQVFGDNVCLWFIPIFSSKSSGHTFHVLNRILE